MTGCKQLVNAIMHQLQACRDISAGRQSCSHWPACVQATANIWQLREDLTSAEERCRAAHAEADAASEAATAKK